MREGQAVVELRRMRGKRGCHVGSGKVSSMGVTPRKIPKPRSGKSDHGDSPRDNDDPTRPYMSGRPNNASSDLPSTVLHKCL